MGRVCHRSAIRSGSGLNRPSLRAQPRSFCRTGPRWLFIWITRLRLPGFGFAGSRCLACREGGTALPCEHFLVLGYEPLTREPGGEVTAKLSSPWQQTGRPALQLQCRRAMRDGLIEIAVASCEEPEINPRIGQPHRPPHAAFSSPAPGHDILGVLPGRCVICSEPGVNRRHIELEFVVIEHEMMPWLSRFRQPAEDFLACLKHPGCLAIAHPGVPPAGLECELHACATDTRMRDTCLAQRDRLGKSPF